MSHQDAAGFYHRQARPLGHERTEASVERPRLVGVVEDIRVLVRHSDQLRREDLEARVLDAGDDLARHALGDRVRLDDRECPFDGHGPSTFATVAPISAGLLTSVAPAASSARIFSAAVPLPPAMIAPACPMRRPGGAVWPQMKATTGFLT